MRHLMGLQPEYFNAIKNGNKKYELRINDEKRKLIKKGDIIGVNVCSKEQKEIATVIGNTHSKETNKLQNISYKTIGNAILLDNSKANLVCEVIDIIHLKNIEDDNLIYMKIQKMDEDDNKDYLTMADF